MQLCSKVIYQQLTHAGLRSAVVVNELSNNGWATRTDHPGRHAGLALWTHMEGAKFPTGACVERQATG